MSISTRFFFPVFAAALLAQAQQPSSSRPNPLVLENEEVKVLKVTNKAGQKSRMHDHKVNRVMIYLGEGGQQLAYQDGKVQNMKWKAGQALWSPASGMHTSENLSGKDYQIVEIELKNKGNAAKVTAPLDPVKIDKKHYKVEMENDQVRVIRFKAEPGAKIAMHEHPLNRVVVYLSDTHMTVRPKEGAPVENRKSAGDVSWAGPTSHSEENSGSGPIELLAIEIKK